MEIPVHCIKNNVNSRSVICVACIVKSNSSISLNHPIQAPTSKINSTNFEHKHNTISTKGVYLNAHTYIKSNIANHSPWAVPASDATSIPPSQTSPPPQTPTRRTHHTFQDWQASREYRPTWHPSMPTVPPPRQSA